MNVLGQLGALAILLSSCAEQATDEPSTSPEPTVAAASAQNTATPPAASPSPLRRWLRPVDAWLEHAKKHRVQILVRANGTEHSFRADVEYVYPASAIKTFLAVAALRELRSRTSLDDNPLAAKIDRLQRVSDNAAFAELYDFVGHRELNELWWGLGFDSVRFHHRMGGTREAGLHTPAVSLGGLRIAARHSSLVLPPTPASKIEMGTRHRTRNGKLINRPMSFAAKNYVSLRELQRLNISLVEPGSPDAVDLGLMAVDRDLLLASMSVTSSEEQKPLLAGIRGAMGDAQIRYVGKSGRAYGFHIANAYVENLANQRSFYVTAAIHDNPNGVMNDDVYNYAGFTQPFMTALGEALAANLLR